MTAKQAIQTGKKVVNTPISILVVSPLICLLLYAFIENGGEVETFKSLLIAVGIGLALSWIYWSFVAPKWLVWAYKKVENKSELYARAVKGNLIWRKGHWANKTLIFSKKDKAFIEEIEKNISYGDRIKPLETEMDFYITKATFLVLSFVVFTFAGCGIIFIIEYIKEDYWPGILSGVVILCLALYTVFRKLPFTDFPVLISLAKKYFSGKSQISINKQGISIRQERTGLIKWKNLLYANVEYDSDNRADKLKFAYYKGKENIHITTDLGLLSGDFEEMEYLIRHYQNNAK
jgi:hypothetical protein